MTAKRAFVWLLLLTLALVGLTVAVHYIPLPVQARPPAASPVVVPAPDEPMLSAMAEPPAAAGRAPAAA